MNKLSPHDLQHCLLRTPPFLLERMKRTPGHIFVAGGFIRAIVAGEPVNDVDVFTDGLGTQQMLFVDLQDRSPNSVTTDNARTFKDFNPVIQVITRWTFKQGADVIKSFDYTVCAATFWWTGQMWDSAVHDNFYSDLAAKRLVYCAPKRDEEAGGSALRLLKYYHRGYRAPLDTYAAVLARLFANIPPGAVDLEKEIRDRLYEVDPTVDPEHIAHLPMLSGDTRVVGATALYKTY